MRDGFVFYKSFYEAIQALPKKDRLTVFEAICDYALNDIEPKMSSGTLSAIFTVVKPQIDANNKRYENGKKGGRPPKETSGLDNDSNGNDNKKPLVSKSENHRFSDEKPKEKEKEKDKDKEKEKGASGTNGNQRGVPISAEQKENRDRIMRGLNKAIQ